MQEQPYLNAIFLQSFNSWLLLPFSYTRGRYKYFQVNWYEKGNVAPHCTCTDPRKWIRPSARGCLGKAVSGEMVVSDPFPVVRLFGLWTAASILPRSSTSAGSLFGSPRRSTGNSSCGLEGTWPSFLTRCCYCSTSDEAVSCWLRSGASIQHRGDTRRSKKGGYPPVESFLTVETPNRLCTTDTSTNV